MNPLGDEVLDRLDNWWEPTSCAAAAGDAVPAGEATDELTPAGSSGSAPSTAVPTPSGCWSPTSTGTTGALTDVLRRMEIVRLGYGVDRTGRIDPEAMERTLAMSREYAGQCASLGAESVRFAATSASRDAANAGEFVEGVREAFARVRDDARGDHRGRGGGAVVPRGDR